MTFRNEKWKAARRAERFGWLISMFLWGFLGLLVIPMTEKGWLFGAWLMCLVSGCWLIRAYDWSEIKSWIENRED